MIKIELDDSTEIGGSISQMDLILAISKHLTKKEKIKNINGRQYNALIRAANLICDELAKPHVSAVPGMTMAQWFACDDTGISSKFLANWLSAEARFLNPNREDGYPRDSADFQRCVKMIRATGLQERLGLEISGTPAQRELRNYDEWNIVFDSWIAWERLLDDGQFKQLSEEMAVALNDKKSSNK